MQIVWDPKAVEDLKKTHTVLELESFPVNGGMFHAWCVLPAEKIIAELPTLNNYIELHEGFVKAWKDRNYKLLEDLSEHLKGKFGGELDSFYEEILSRIPADFKNDSKT
jgi:hypothetical protein